MPIKDVAVICRNERPVFFLKPIFGALTFHIFLQQAICFAPHEDSSKNNDKWATNTHQVREKFKDVNEVSAEMHNMLGQFLHWRGELGDYALFARL